MKKGGKIEYRIYKRRGELEKSARSSSRRRRLPPPGDRHHYRRGGQLGRKTRRAARDEKRERDEYPFSRVGKERETEEYAVCPPPPPTSYYPSCGRHLRLPTLFSTGSIVIFIDWIPRDRASALSISLSFSILYVSSLPLAIYIFFSPLLFHCCLCTMASSSLAGRSLRQHPWAFALFSWKRVLPPLDASIL